MSTESSDKFQAFLTACGETSSYFPDVAYHEDGTFCTQQQNTWDGGEIYRWRCICGNSGIEDSARTLWGNGSVISDEQWETDQEEAELEYLAYYRDDFVREFEAGMRAMTEQVQLERDLEEDIQMTADIVIVSTTPTLADCSFLDVYHSVYHLSVVVDGSAYARYADSAGVWWGHVDEMAQAAREATSWQDWHDKWNGIEEGPLFDLLQREILRHS